MLRKRTLAKNNEVPKPALIPAKRDDAPMGKVLRGNIQVKPVPEDVIRRWNNLRNSRPHLQMIDGPAEMNKFFRQETLALVDAVNKYLSLADVNQRQFSHNIKSNPMMAVNKALHMARIFNGSKETFNESFNYLAFLYSKEFNPAQHLMREKKRLSNSFNQAFASAESVDFETRYLTDKHRHEIILYAACYAVESDLAESATYFDELATIKVTYEECTGELPPGYDAFIHPIFKGKLLESKFKIFEDRFVAIDDYGHAKISEYMLKDMLSYLSNLENLEMLVLKYLKDAPANPVAYILENKMFSIEGDLSISLNKINNLLSTMLPVRASVLKIPDNIIVSSELTLLHRQAILLALVIDAVREEYRVAPEELSRIIIKNEFELVDQVKKVQLLVLKVEVLSKIKSVWPYYKTSTFATSDLDNYTRSWISNFVKAFLGIEWEYQSQRLEAVIGFIMKDYISDKDKCYAALGLLSLQDLLPQLNDQDAPVLSFEMPKNNNKTCEDFAAEGFRESLNILDGLVKAVPEVPADEVQNENREDFSSQFDCGMSIEAHDLQLSSEAGSNESDVAVAGAGAEVQPLAPESFEEGFVIVEIDEVDAEEICSSFELMPVPEPVSWCSEELLRSAIEKEYSQLSSQNAKRSAFFMKLFQGSYGAAKAKEILLLNLMNAVDIDKAKEFYDAYKRSPNFRAKGRLIEYINDFFEINAQLDNYALGGRN